MKTSMKMMNRKIHFVKKAVTLGLITLAFVSCGKSSENEVRSEDVSNNPSSNPVLVGAGNDLNAFWNNLKTQHACPQSTGRMSDITFTLQGSAYGNEVYGSMSPGSVGGQVTQTYTGLNTGTKDLMFVSQVLNNGQVAYNVVISFCRYVDQWGQEFIGENAGLRDFQVQLSLDNSTNCPTGQIDDGWIQFRSNLMSYDARRFSTVNTSCY